MDLKKVLSFVLLFLWAMGVAVAAWLSWPKVTELFHNLTD